MSLELAIDIAEFLVELSLDLDIKTVEWYSHRLSPFLDWLARQCVRSPTDITERHIKEFLALQKKEGKSWSTRNGAYTAIKRFLSWCEVDSPFRDGNIKRPRKPRQVVKPLKLEYIRRMIAAAEKEAASGTHIALRDVAIMRLLLNTGIRRAELVRLEIPDVDFDTGDILVTGKFDHERVITCSERTLGAIQKWLTIRPETEHQTLFIALWYTKSGIHHPMRPDAVNDLLKSWRDRAGIPQRVSVSPHKWRHTFATEFASRTNNPFALQEILGHANIETTKIYVQLSRSVLRQLALENAPDVE